MVPIDLWPSLAHSFCRGDHLRSLIAPIPHHKRPKVRQDSRFPGQWTDILSHLNSMVCWAMTRAPS